MKIDKKNEILMNGFDVLPKKNSWATHQIWKDEYLTPNGSVSSVEKIFFWLLNSWVIFTVKQNANGGVEMSEVWNCT